jgi:hypothetical protein
MVVAFLIGEAATFVGIGSVENLAARLETHSTSSACGPQGIGYGKN